MTTQNFLFDHARAALKAGEIDWERDNIKAMLLTAGFGFSPQSHERLFLGNIPLPACISEGVPLTGRQLIDGCISAKDITFPADALSPDRNDISALVIYCYSGNAATSPLIAYLGDAEGLPLKPCGSPILFHWDLEKPRIHSVAIAVNLAGAQPQVERHA